MPTNYKHFTENERDCLDFMLRLGFTLTFIARLLGKHKSSVSRELKRNRTDNFYLSREAHEKAVRRRCENKPSSKMDNKILVNEIIRRVALTHSPEQIAGRLKFDFPDDTQMHISHETVYKIIYGENE